MFNQSTIVFIRGRIWYGLILSIISKISNFAICRPKHGAKARIGLWLEEIHQVFRMDCSMWLTFRENMSGSHLYSEADFRTCYRNVNHQQSFLVLYPAKSFHFRKKRFWLVYHGEHNNIKESSFGSRCRHLIGIAMFRRGNSASLLQTMEDDL